MNCLWCGVPFVAKDFAQKTCCATHGKSQRAKRSKVNGRPLVKCPNPYKKAFGYRGEAVRFAYENNQAFYECECGIYHITSFNPRHSYADVEIAFEYYEKGLTCFEVINEYATV